jgi:hypothetical protein
MLLAAVAPQPAIAGSGISGFSHFRILVNQTISIFGEGLTDASAVTFKGAAATEFTVVDDTTIDVKVPIGALTGKVKVVVPSGTLVSPTRLRVAPWVTSVQPFSAPRGSTIEIGGYTFTGASKVLIFGEPAEFTVHSYTRITAVVPDETRTGFGTLKVKTPGGIGRSPRFRVT